MTQSHHSTTPREVVLGNILDAYLTYLLLPGFNAVRAAYGIEPALPGPPVTREEAIQASEELQLIEACRKAADDEPRIERRPRHPRLDRVIARAEKATGKTVTSVTTSDGTTLNFGDPEPSEANNPWLADLKVTKQ